MDQDALLALRRFVTNKNWHSLTSTCRNWMSYAHCNKALVVPVNLPRFPLPEGCTKIVIHTELYSSEIQWKDSVRTAVCSMQGRLFMEPMVRVSRNLTTLKLSGDEPFDPRMMCLPDSLVFLGLYFSFGYNVVGWDLPSGLRVLKLDGEFDAPVRGWRLPRSLQRLSLSTPFDQPVGPSVDYPNGWELPSGLKELEFGYRFNQSVSGWNLPSSLKKLIFGMNFNQPLGQCGIPESLSTLVLSGVWNQSLMDWKLPSGLTHLRIPECWNQATFLPDGRFVKLPDGIKEFSFPGRFDQPVVFPCGSWTLSESLVELDLGCFFNQPVEGWVLPPKLRKLHISGRFDQPVKNWILPDTLEELDLESDFFNQPVNGWRLPRSLKRLVFGPAFRAPLHNLDLPDGLKVLILPRRYTANVEALRLPSSLRMLQVPYVPAKLQLPCGLIDLSITLIPPEAGVQFPAGLKSLVIAGVFNAPLETLNLPDGIEHLTVGSCFRQKVNPDLLPSSLKHISVIRTSGYRLSNLEFTNDQFHLIGVSEDSQFSAWVNVGIATVALPYLIAVLMHLIGFK